MARSKTKRQSIGKPDRLINKIPVDRFTVAHFGAGCVGGAFDIDWKLFMAGAIGWEVLEHVLKDSHPGLFPNPSQDSLGNATCDVLAAGLGFGAMRSLRAIEADKRNKRRRRRKR